MNLDLIKVWEGLSKRIYDKYVYGYVVLIALILDGVILISHLSDPKEDMLRIAVVATLMLFGMAVLLCVVIKLHRHLPKFRVDETGILFIISTTTSNEREALENKFVKKVAWKFADEFYQKSIVKLLDPFNTEKFLTSGEEEKKQIIIESNAKLVIWGTFEKGKTNGKEAYFLRLESGVAHGRISDDLSKMLSYNMVNVMQPIRNICVLEDNNKIDFDLAADATELIAQYIMAEACYFSGYVDRSISIFSSLSDCLKQNRRNLPYLALLKNASKKRLAELYTVLSCICYKKYRQTEDKNELKKMKCSLDMLFDLNGANLAYYQQMALYYFCIRSIDKAKECVCECKKLAQKNVITMYDDVFLKLYSGYTPYVAYRGFTTYKSIFNKNKDIELISDIEDFVSWIIKKEPEKVWLNWLLALLANEREDYCLSDKCLRVFLDWESVESNERLNECIDKLKKANSHEQPLV